MYNNKITKQNKTKQNKTKQNRYSLCIVAVFFFFVHLYINPCFGDEIQLQAKIMKWNGDIFAFLGHRYFVWSSRTLIDFIMISMSCIPSVIWKILDYLCILVLCYIMAKYAENKLYLALLLITYPFMHMASAGWIATTVVYLWPFTFWLISLYIFDNFLQKKF